VISQKAAVSVVYAGVMFIAVMDQTIVNVALAAIGRQFQTSATAVAGAVIAYQVSVALFIPAAAWLGDRFGPRQVLLGSIALFTAASALCGLAGSLDELVAFRVLQGAGGGPRVRYWSRRWSSSSCGRRRPCSTCACTATGYSARPASCSR
jgi:MFS family permease